MYTIGYYGKEYLEKYIQYVDKYNIKKEIKVYEDCDYNKEYDFLVYLCHAPHRTFTEELELSKSEMLYLQERGFIFRNSEEKIINVNTLIW